MDHVLRRIDEPTPRGIAAAISRLITSGELAPGDRLPTVRGLAEELGVSPATVSQAWQTLTRAGLITSRGRSGSFVRASPREWLPLRYRGLDGEDARLDLSRGTPDVALLPDLRPALARVAEHLALPTQEAVKYQAKPDIPELHDLLRDTWPAAVESLTVTNGALDAVDRALATLVRYGDRIALESPGFPPFLDLAEHYGLEPVPIAMDVDGPDPASFASALSQHPQVVILQPRAQNPTGTAMTTERAEQLAQLVRRSRVADSVVIIEDDHSGAISTAPNVSLASLLPERVLHVRSFSKTFGPDLRIGALGGPRPLVDRIVARRLLGPGWTSRMTQKILFDLLTNADTTRQVDRAREIYARRQTAFRRALAERGVPLPHADGLNAWVPVRDEREALVHLAAAGIRAAPGTPFQLGDRRPHVRITVGAIDGVPTDVATALASVAERPGRVA